MKILVHNHSTLPADTAPSLADVIRAQERAGCTVLTDGFYSSRDPVWLAIECVEGVEPGVPTDYYSAGFHVPRPVVRNHLHYHQGAAVERWRSAQAESNFPLKAVLPGPLTLADLSDFSHSPYNGLEAMAEAWATALLPEFAALVAAGCTYIQLEEPAILRRAQAIRLLRDLLQPFWDSREKATLLVSTWGADTEALYAQLHSLPADVVGVDIARNPQLLDLIIEVGASQQLYLGLLNPASSNMPADGLLPKLERVLHHYEFADIHFGPACGLSSVEPQAAIDCLRQIHQLTKGLSAVSPATHDA